MERLIFDSLVEALGEERAYAEAAYVDQFTKLADILAANQGSKSMDTQEALAQLEVGSLELSRITGESFMVLAKDGIENAIIIAGNEDIGRIYDTESTGQYDRDRQSS